MSSYEEEYWWLIGAISSCMFFICLFPLVCLLCQNRKESIYKQNLACQKRIIRAEIDLSPVEVQSSKSAGISRIEYFSRV